MAAYYNPARRTWIGDDRFKDMRIVSFVGPEKNSVIINNDESFCLLDRLADVPDVAYIVISMLEYFDVVHLAAVNKKWYKTVVYAPQSIKPVTEKSGFFMQNGKVVISFSRFNKTSRPIQNEWTLEPNNAFNMIRRIESYLCWIRTYTGSREDYHKNLIKSFEFLVNHQMEFDICQIQFEYPSLYKIEYSLFSRFFAAFNFFSIISLDETGCHPSWREDLQRVILESLSLKSFTCRCRLDSEFVHNFLMQVVGGLRPDFCGMLLNVSINQTFFERTLRDIEPSQLRRIDDMEYEIDILSMNRCFVLELLEYDLYLHQKK